jgi:cytochrome c oxidase subunit 4
MEHAPVHEQHHPGPKQYIIIGVVLGVITLVEVAAFYLYKWDVTPALIALVLLLLTASKFVLVVGYFMHLRFDDKRFLALFVVPFVIAVSVMIALLGLFQNLTR